MSQPVRRKRHREPIYVDWGWQQFKLARAKTGLSQAEVSRRLGGSPSQRSIASWERPGTVPSGKVTRLVEFYESLGITPETMRTLSQAAVRAAINDDRLMSKTQKQSAHRDLDETSADE
jgi:transcriptional regulator with XRE-family HTH domain